MAKRSAPEVNAGSMADIAFLLLIFFLVTNTIETDSGLNRKLPPMEDVVDPPIIKERNIFTVVVNKNNDLLVEEKPMEISELRDAAVAFWTMAEAKEKTLVTFVKELVIPLHRTTPKKQLFRLKTTEKLTTKSISPFKMSWWQPTMFCETERSHVYIPIRDLAL